MPFFSQWRHGAAAFSLLLLAACGSQNDTIDTPVVRPVSVAPAGIYEGTWTATSTGKATAVTAFLDSDGAMMTFDASGELIASGAYTTVESARGISWTAQVFEPETTTDTETGETTTTTKVTTLSSQGSYAEGSSILLTLNRSTGDTATLSLAYDEDAYESRSDVSLIQGNWGLKNVFGAPTIAIAIDAGGNFSGSDIDNCSYSGTFTPIDQQYNLYKVLLKTSCTTETPTGGSTATNTTTTGLATLKAATSSTGKKTLVSVSTLATNSVAVAQLWMLNPL